MLTLTDCYGRIPGYVTGTATTEATASYSEDAGEEPRLSFLSLPLLLRFDIDDAVRAGTGKVVTTLNRCA